MFFAKINKSCLITYIGIAFGILSMYFSFAKMALVDTCYIRYSLVCLVISGICDMFDGKFARMCKRTKEEKEFGVQLDSLADTVCFLAVPVVFMLSLGMVKWYYVMVYIIFIICGVSRLGYFNVHADLDEAVKSYHGLPVTSTAISYPVMGLLHVFVSPFVFEMCYLGLTIITAFLMIVNINIPKFKGLAYVIIPILALLLVVLLLVI